MHYSINNVTQGWYFGVVISIQDLLNFVWNPIRLTIFKCQVFNIWRAVVQSFIFSTHVLCWLWCALATGVLSGLQRQVNSNYNTLTCFHTICTLLTVHWLHYLVLVCMWIWQAADGLLISVSPHLHEWAYLTIGVFRLVLWHTEAVLLVLTVPIEHTYRGICLTCATLLASSLRLALSRGFSCTVLEQTLLLHCS